MTGTAWPICCLALHNFDRSLLYAAGPRGRVVTQHAILIPRDRCGAGRWTMIRAVPAELAARRRCVEAGKWANPHRR